MNFVACCVAEGSKRVRGIHEAQQTMYIEPFPSSGGGGSGKEAPRVLFATNGRLQGDICFDLARFSRRWLHTTQLRTRAKIWGSKKSGAQKHLGPSF